MVTGDALDLVQGDGDALFAELADQFADRGWRWCGIHTSHAVVRPPEPARIRTYPPGAVAGENIDPYLPRGPDAASWHRYMNECQMCLHACAINAERERSAAPPINSIWFWGSGVLPVAPQAVPWDLVFSDGPLFQGLAELVGAQTLPVPVDWHALRDQIPEGGRALLTCCRPHALFQPPAYAAASVAMNELDDTWLSPAVHATLAGELDSLRVLDTTYGDVMLTARAARRWWRAWGWSRALGRARPQPKSRSH